MRGSIRTTLMLLPLLAGAWQARAQDPNDPLPAIRANQWALAQTQAASYADPVAEKLVLFYRLLDPGAATPAEIAAFLHANPDWPDQLALKRRWQEAIAADPDDQDVVQQCAAAHPSEPATLLRCAQALENTGDKSAAEVDARRAWITGITTKPEERAFLHHWGDVITPAVQWTRFQHLSWYNSAAAARQMARLDPAYRRAAVAQLALQHDDAKAEQLLAEVPAGLRDDPGLILDEARYLRRADRLGDAAALWRDSGAAAQAMAPDHRTAFWNERSLLARKLLAQGDNQAAYDVVRDHGELPSAAMADAEFLTGFIALRRLHDPAAAMQDFRELARSHAAITEGRAEYWMGRAAAAAGADPKPYYEKAANWPTTFYGQLGALASGETPASLARRIDALRDPAWNRDTVLAFTGHEVVRAAAWLVAWGDPRRARAFLLRMDELAPSAAEQALTAQFALKLGVPEVAVFIARRMGFHGTLLAQAGWPMPYDPPADGLDPAVALGIMRQESSFDTDAISPSGARGLMQLMPPTAAEVAKQLGVRTSLISLTADPAHNMQLGTSYLQAMLAHFDGSLPLAVAAYNAGPHRVEQWLGVNGDPRSGAVDMLDWLELIPSGETRNYVQRVLENVVIYRARLGESAPTLLAEWTQ
ncbi:MAG TPA: lytic transglycosylase domain-containing protein [Acetobacteraceae bacterium]|nr:lytic transglycosylase domain-containing protein [Acetobacteraceae bacterium]